MKPLFMSWFCPKECDRVKVTAAVDPLTPDWLRGYLYTQDDGRKWTVQIVPPKSLPPIDGIWRGWFLLEKPSCFEDIRPSLDCQYGGTPGWVPLEGSRTDPHWALLFRPVD